MRADEKGQRKNLADGAASHLQRFRTRDRWQTSSGLIQTATRRSLPSLRGEFPQTFARSLRSPADSFCSARPCSGAGYTFGAQVVKKFLNLNKFEHMLRAHQLCMDGYSELFGDPPLLSTVWSAPNVSLNAQPPIVRPSLTVETSLVLVLLSMRQPGEYP